MKGGHGEGGHGEGGHGEGGHGGMNGGKGTTGEGHSTEGSRHSERAGEPAVSTHRNSLTQAAAEAYSPAVSAKVKRAETIEGLAKLAFTSQEPGYENTHVPQKNADCGPSALSTAMKALHDIPATTNVGREITHLREQMTGADNHQQPTSPKEIARAATLNGLTATTINGMKELNQALAQHKVVVQLGEPGNIVGGVNFAGTHPKVMNTMEHFVAVIGRNPLTGHYVVDSSERKGPIDVTPQQMHAFMDTSEGVFNGVALSKDRSSQPEGKPHGHLGQPGQPKTQFAPPDTVNSNFDRSKSDYLRFDFLTRK